jgi:GH15 family glucan-1,4-alpha-glucosidase
VLYRLDGGHHAPETTLPLEGYRHSAPVRVGNGAATQLQLDTYGELLQSAWLYAQSGAPVDRDIARRLAQLADFVTETWRKPDSGIWEVRSEPTHFTQSKVMCWVALDRALDLAARGIIPGRHAGRWREQATQIRKFVETRCWSEQKRSYVRFAGSEELDASLLLAVVHGYADARDDRLRATVDTVRKELGEGPFLRRYSGDDGVSGSEGAFVACSFWLVEALARCGRLEEATALMDELIELANEVGLYAEEIDPKSGAFLGNIPQGLSHLALITAAMAIDQEARR